jgi:2-haloacid dehalogenase
VNRRELLLAVAALAVQPGAHARSGTRAIVFDAYGTLFDVHSVVALANELFPGQGDALSQRWRQKQLDYSWLLSQMNQYEDFWSVTGRALTFACGALKLSCSATQHDRLMDAYLHLSAFPDAVEGLKRLSGRPLAILSNGSPKMLAAVVRSAHLEGMFKHVISVDEVKIYKPSPRVYRLAVDRLGVPAGGVLFVSSNFWDVAGAKAFGFRACWVNRDDAPADELGVMPDVVVKSLAELPQTISE